MKRTKLLTAGVVILLVHIGAASAPAPAPGELRDEWFAGLDLEPAVNEAELILVGRIEEVRNIPLPIGGKGEDAMLQIRFSPVRVLKGVFARETLTLTNYDLRIVAHGSGLDRLGAGDLRLLFLGRARTGYYNLNPAAHADSSLPPLANVGDPMTDSVATLLAVRAAGDRTRRVALLTEALGNAQGASAVPLLNALSRRSLIAAQHGATLAALALHLDDSSPAVRAAAGHALAAILGADYLEQATLRTGAASALGAALRKSRVNGIARVALIEAAGELGAAGRGVVPPLPPDALLSVQQARIRALARIGENDERVRPLLERVPLDHPNSGAYEFALAQREPASAATAIPNRAALKWTAGLDVETEIGAAADLPVEHATAMLVRISRLDLNAGERLAFASVAARIATTSPKSAALGQLVAPLSGLLDAAEPHTRHQAIGALLAIDTAAAARALAPHFTALIDLEQKLTVAGMLGKHGIRDGYPYVIEHMSEPALLEKAVDALAAIGDERAVDEARRILETSQDESWQRAAIRTLGVMGAREEAPRLLAIIDRGRGPLVPAALVALGDLGERRALPPVEQGLASRSEAIVAAAARAAGYLIDPDDRKSGAIRDALAALVTDTNASEPLRDAALESLRRIRDPRLDTALVSAVTDAVLEGTELLAKIEKLVRERRLPLATSRLPAES